MRAGGLVEHPVRLALLALMAMLSVIVYVRGLGPDAERAAAPEPGVGYYLREAILTGTGPDGGLLYRLRTERAEESLADGSITLTGVGIDYSPPGAAPWQLSADRGQIPADRAIIRLSGDVVAATRTEDQPLTRIRTESLVLDPDAYVASTSETVTVERGRGTLRARGMRVYLKEDRLELVGKVEGRFAP